MKTLLKNLPVVILCGLVVTIPYLRAQQEVAPERFDRTTAAAQKKKAGRRHTNLKANRMQQTVKKDARDWAKDDLRPGARAAVQSKVAR